MSNGAIVHEVCVGPYTISKRNNNGTGKEERVTVTKTVQAVEGRVELTKTVNKSGKENQLYVYK